MTSTAGPISLGRFNIPPVGRRGTNRATHGESARYRIHMELPEGWVVWSADDRIVWTYRPDVFDGDAFPSACLPTIYIRQGRRDRRPGVDHSPPPDAPWAVTLTLEPDVARTDDGLADRAAAIAHAEELAASFVAGEVDFRALYQVPDDREAYLDRLVALTGRTS